jgi:dienelactone hydrolase
MCQYSSCKVRNVLLGGHCWGAFTACTPLCTQPLRAVALPFLDAACDTQLVPHGVCCATGGNDIMVTEQDVQEQLRRLPNASVLMYKHYNHMDFVW